MNLERKERKFCVSVLNECSDLGNFIEQAAVVFRKPEYHGKAKELLEYCVLHHKKDVGVLPLTKEEKARKAELKISIYDTLKGIELS